MPIFAPRQIPYSEQELTFDPCSEIAQKMVAGGFIGAAVGAFGGALSSVALKTCSLASGAIFGATATAVGLISSKGLSYKLYEITYKYVRLPTAKDERIIDTLSVVGSYFMGTGVGYAVCKVAGVEMGSLPNAMEVEAVSIAIVAATALTLLGCCYLWDTCQHCIAYINRPVPPEGNGGPIPGPRNPIVQREAPVANPFILNPLEGPGDLPEPRREAAAGIGELALEIVEDAPQAGFVDQHEGED